MLEERFFLSREGDPLVYSGCRVTPLINASGYFAALADDLARLGCSADPQANRGQFLYIAGYALNLLYPDDPLMLPDPRGPQRMFDILVEKARLGVDVRILVWIPWTLALANRIDLRPESADNMRSVLALRQEPALRRKVCLNILSHPVGSAHAKLVVMGGPDWSSGYTGGIDFSPDRALPDWLDLQARLEGPGVQPMYDFFAGMWNDNLHLAGDRRAGNEEVRPQVGFQRNALNELTNQRETRPEHIRRATDHRRELHSRPARLGWLLTRRPTVFQGREGTVESVVDGTPPVKRRQLAALVAGSHLVQHLVTLPVFRYALHPLLPTWRVAPTPSAPHGRFQARDGLKKAILAAERYIYIEDQYLWSQEVMRWINAALRKSPLLKVVLATGVSDQIGDRLDAYRNQAVAAGLLPGLDESQSSRIGVYRHPHNLHAKTTIIDDRWAFIGSTNIARRSLYTDIEHNISFEDPAGQAVRNYRTALWTSRLRLSDSERSELSDIGCALQLWRRRWAAGCTPQQAPASPFSLITGPSNPPPDVDAEWYDMVDDPDSRRPWYFPLRTSYPEYR